MNHLQHVREFAKSPTAGNKESSSTDSNRYIQTKCRVTGIISLIQLCSGGGDYQHFWNKTSVMRLQIKTGRMKIPKQMTEAGPQNVCPLETQLQKKRTHWSARAISSSYSHYRESNRGPASHLFLLSSILQMTHLALNLGVHCHHVYAHPEPPRGA